MEINMGKTKSAKTVIFGMRLTPEMKRRAEEEAHKQGRSLGNFVRRAIELAIVDELNRDKVWGIDPGERYGN